MYQGMKFTLAAAVAFFIVNTAQAATDPTTFVGPSLQGTYTSWMTPISAFSLLAQGGPKEFRASATFAWQFQDVERIKLTGEYLTDRLNYQFYPSNLSRWREQGAVGFDYQYQIDRRYDPIFDLSAFGSFTPSTKLEPYLYFPRRIAGATGAAGMSAGMYVDGWCGAKLGLLVNYDAVRYDTRYDHPHPNGTGWGATASLTQVVTDNIALSFSVADRAPFNVYQGSINYGALYHGRWDIELFANYTNGKEHLPNSANAGLSFNYYVDRISYSKPHNLTDEPGVAVVTDVDVDFINWASDPAVYMPEVLAVGDKFHR